MNTLALRITFDRIACKARARQERAANPKMRVDLRLSALAVERLDAAAAASGIGLDEQVERMAMEAGT